MPRNHQQIIHDIRLSCLVLNMQISPLLTLHSLSMLHMVQFQPSLWPRGVLGNIISANAF